jgi:hypothetical protein
MGKYITSTCVAIVILSQLAIPFAYAQTAQTTYDFDDSYQYSNGYNAPATPNINSTNSLYDSYSQTNTLQLNAADRNAQANAKAIGNNTKGSQAQGFNNGVQNQNNGGNSSNFTANAVGCSVGQILGNIVQAGVSGLVSEITGAATDEVASQVSTGQYVPTDPQTIKTEVKNINKDTASQTNKDVGGGHKGLLASLTDSISSISWDSIGFCLANATVHYIAQSTINWINSGFDGNPTFVDNPGKFFQDMADAELGGFIEELGLGFLCSGVAPKVRIAIVNDYMNRNWGKAFNNRYKCSFDKIGTNLEAFKNNYANGGIDAFVKFVYNPASRPSTAYLAAQEELGRRINTKQGQAQFELRTSDFMSFKKCDQVSDVKTRQIKNVNCRTYTPGSVIQSQLESTLNLPKDRVAIADEFDEVIAALVNQLIKTALSEVTSGGDSEYNQDQEKVEEEDIPNYQVTQQGQVVNRKPAPLPAVGGVCTVATTTVAVDESVEFSVIPRGGNRSYSFDWMGGTNFPTSTTASRIAVTFATTTNASNVSVRVRSANKSAIVSCPAVQVTPPAPLIVSCAPDDTTATLGQNITWQSDVSGGTNYYTYAWDGDINGTEETNQDNDVTYNSKGTYSASLVVTSGSQTKSVSCSNTVKVK